MSMSLSLEELEQAAARVYRYMPPTAQYSWPLLSQRAGCEVWVKHENHTPTGAFKVRGGLNYMQRLKQEQPCVSGVITATRGNHGQSIGFAAGVTDLKATILTPVGNNPETSRATRALGVELIEHGEDFQAAAEYAQTLAATKGLHMIKSFDPWLVAGVASYGLEFFRAIKDLDAVFVPVGMGSGICALIQARNALGLKIRIYGVSAENAPAYALSFKAGRVVSTERADTLADGVATRIPDELALETILDGAADIITVSEDEILAAMAHYFTDTRNIAEGAGAVPLAALLQRRDEFSGKKVGLVLSGCNVYKDLLKRVMEVGD